VTKTIAAWTYCLGMLSAVIAVVSRLLAVVGIWPASHIASGKLPISYWSFYEAAVLLFVASIASAVQDLGR
jgi:hypothetical protein